MPRGNTIEALSAHVPGGEPWTVVYSDEPVFEHFKHDSFAEACDLLLPAAMRERKLAAEGEPPISDRRAQLAWSVCYAARETSPVVSLAFGIATDIGVGTLRDEFEAHDALVRACYGVPRLLPLLQARYRFLVKEGDRLQLRYFGSE